MDLIVKIKLGSAHDMIVQVVKRTVSKEHILYSSIYIKISKLVNL
jgi:hypothetical protein